MESNQPRVQEVASDNITEREVQPPKPPKRKKKKVSFKVWLEQQELKTSAENIKQQDTSPVTEKESIDKALETVDQTGDKPAPESETDEQNQEPIQTCSEEQVPVDEEISKGNNENQNESLVTKQESISVLQETPVKKQSFESGVEKVKNQDSSLAEEAGGQEHFLKKDIFKEELVISKTELVNENANISKSLKKENQKWEKQASKSKRIKKTPLLWKSFPEPEGVIDLTFFTDNSDINNGPLPEKQNDQAAVPSSGKKTIWKMFPKSEPWIDVSFIAENIETQSVSMTAEGRDEADSLEKDSYSKKTVISTTQQSNNQESIIKPKETLDRKREKSPSTGKPKDLIQTETLPELPRDQTTENVPGESLDEIQILPHSSEKTTSQAQCACLAKIKEAESGYIKVQKYLMQQLDKMFDTNKKLNAKLKQQKDMLRKILSERRQSIKPMVSVQTQTDSEETPKQKTVQYQSASTQTETDLQENSNPPKPVCDTISTQTELFFLLKQKPSETQLNGHQLETHSDENCEPQDISIVGTVGNPIYSIKNDIHMIETEIAKVEQITKEEPVSETQQNGDQLREKKLSRKYKYKIKRKAARKAACELKAVTNKNISGENSDQQEISALETAGDQTAAIEPESHTNETDKTQQATKEETISESQQSEIRNQHQKKTSKKYKRKKKKKAAMRAASKLEHLNNDQVFVKNTEEEDVSIPEIVKDQTATIIIEIFKNETVNAKLQQATEDKMIHEIQENGNQPKEKRSKSKCRKRRKRARKAGQGAVVNPAETDHNTKTTKPDLEIPENPQTASEQVEIKPCIESEDATGRVPVVSTGLVEKHRTSPPQIKATSSEDTVQTTAQESQTLAAEESTEQNNDQEESPKKKISLWRRIKKALTPTCLRQFKEK